MRIKAIFFLIGLTLLFSCNRKGSYVTNDGQVYGTFYHIVYQSPGSKDLHTGIKEKFDEYTMSFSTFEKESVISKINNNEPVIPDSYFVNCFIRAEEISEITDGAFDITVAPMVNAWGFGFKNKENISDELIDSLKSITGFRKVRHMNGYIVKDNPNTMLDMSAIAKGYTCDLIGDFLAEKGCDNYMVEIGGEVVARGVNAKGQVWSIGITEPIDDNLFGSSELNAIVRLPDKALATSGNYRNFYIEDGVKYAHTIDPKTGYPVQHSLLSATVMADDCATADAFATAFMVMGLEKGIELSKQIPEIEVYFIYADESGKNQVYYSKKFKRILTN
ncbi:MAG: FAD:protein FMN transferase [Prolixibacteraceae bacterium]|nr:FAD:protein FMN transferase [Prolixibacteraceae bacterium]MBN2774967.1 FAD:protein FMN transferase [Prolixibacteraceae bacterium]